MHTPQPSRAGFRRQVVVRLDPEQSALLDRAASEHGSIQAALVAALHALAHQKTGPPSGAKAAETQPVEPEPPTSTQEGQPKQPATTPEDCEEVTAREAAAILGLKPGTVRGYIRNGRLAGRYDDSPTWLGWLTTRGAVADYAIRRRLRLR